MESFNLLSCLKCKKLPAGYEIWLFAPIACTCRTGSLLAFHVWRRGTERRNRKPQGSQIARVWASASVAWNHSCVYVHMLADFNDSGLFGQHSDLMGGYISVISSVWVVHIFSLFSRGWWVTVWLPCNGPALHSLCPLPCALCWLGSAAGPPVTLTMIASLRIDA